MLLHSQRTVKFAMTALSLTKPLILPWSSMSRVGQPTMTTARQQRTISGARTRSGRRHPSRRYRSAGSSRLEIYPRHAGESRNDHRRFGEGHHLIDRCEEHSDLRESARRDIGRREARIIQQVTASYSVQVLAVPVSLPPTPIVCIRVGNRRRFHPCGVVEYFRSIRMKRVYRFIPQQ
jgi:hypothetical protein